MGRSDEALDVSVNIRVVPRHQCSPQQLAAWDHLWARLLSPDSDELLTAARWRLLELLGRRLRDLQWLADDRERYLRWLWKGEPPADTREPLPPRRRRGR